MGKSATSADAEVAPEMLKLEATGYCKAHGEAQFLCMHAKSEADCTRKSICYWKSATSADAEVAPEMLKLEATGYCKAHGEAPDCTRKSICYWKSATSTDAEV